MEKCFLQLYLNLPIRSVKDLWWGINYICSENLHSFQSIYFDGKFSIGCLDFINDAKIFFDFIIEEDIFLYADTKVYNQS